MRKNNSARAFLAWVFRLSLPIYLIWHYRGDLLNGIDLTDVTDLILLVTFLISLLLILGGFARRPSLTKISAVLIIIMALIGIFKHLGIEPWLLPIFISLYFLFYGNDY